MSVVQISRIQQRRGKKNTDYGFPQLASGELGWAIDTQELYIGNGAVSEGAPYVGNSKILTEHDDILQFIGLYQYQKNNPSIQTGPTSVEPIRRSLQERLDDIVSIRDFGAIGDGIADDTIAIQRAIDQLFLNDATKSNTSSRVILYIEPGEYVISDEIKIPPYAHIVGAGIDSTVIHQTEDYAIFRFVDGISTPGDYTEFASMTYLERPRNILISSLTLQTDTNRIVYLDNTDSSLFDRVKFLGVYVNGTTADDNQVGVEIRGSSRVFRGDNVLFHYCIFNNTGYGIFSDSDHNNINIENCVFYQLYDAINLGGNDDGSVNTSITNCYFDLIDQHGIYIKKGFGNTSNHNKFMLVGNNNLGYAAAAYPIIKFDTDGNQSTGDYFERNRKLKDQDIFAYLPFIPSIESPGMIYDNTNFHKPIDVTPGDPTVFLRLPLFNSGKYIIDYVINKTTSGTAIRAGTMTILVDLDNELSDINDTYHYTGSSTVENIIFSIGIETYASEGTIPDTLTINIYNPTSNGVGNMNYTYRMLTQ